MNTANATKSKDMYAPFLSLFHLFMASYKNNIAKTRYAYCKNWRIFIIDYLVKPNSKLMNKDN